MKEQDAKLTIQEIEQLCHLYMECQLSVFEETELQYVLSKLPYSSPCIDETRALMGLAIPAPKARTFKFFRNKAAIGIAASIAALLAIGFVLSHNTHDDNYVTAYIHGERLDGSEALYATNLAIAKADSLMVCASIAERDFMMKANDIFSTTTNN
ncbi:MAG: hypothetical protein K2N16_08855 [Muribaculaceae bacterium]|nr:hypothetical protein [Muribaculaceae bacterium]